MSMEKQFTTFYLGEERFGVDILLVKEINRHLEITEVAGSPPYIKGLLNLRGQIVTVMDLALRFDRPTTMVTPESRCIVLKTDSELSGHLAAGFVEEGTSEDAVGFLVDRVDDMVTVDQGQVEHSPANISGMDSKFLSGVINLENELIVLIRAREVLVND